jgi:hypothetical protein
MRCITTWAVLAGGLALLLTADRAAAEPAPAGPDRAAFTTAVPASAVSFVRPGWAGRRLEWRFALELEAGPVWQTRNDARIPGDTGTRFAIDDVTGAGPFPWGRVTFDASLSHRHRIRVLAAPLTIEETGTLATPVLFRGTTFGAGAATRATFKFNSYRLGYRYLLASGSRWSVFVGATVKVRDAKIELRQGGTVARKTDLGFVPLLHVDATYCLAPGWRLVADLDGLAAPQGRAFDFALKLQRDLGPRWSVAVGYRTLEGGADNDEVYTFTWLHQALVSVTFRF